jgi:hypothetical protein
MNNGIASGRIRNEAQVVAAIRAARAKGQRDISVTGIPRATRQEKPRREEPTRSAVALFGDYLEAKIEGREKEFLRGLSMDQFTRLAASLERR